MRSVGWMALAALIACDDGGGGGGGGDAGQDCPEVTSSYGLEVAEAPPAEAPAGSVITIDARLTTACGDPVASPLDVAASGGSVTASPLDDGWQRYTWTLAPVPVPQRLSLSFGPASQMFTVNATPTEPLVSADFGGVADFLAAQGNDGITEDLAVTTEALLLPTTGGIVEVAADGTPSWRAVEGLERPLGVARAEDGHLWIADADRQALLEVAPDGSITEHLGPEAPGLLDGPNHLAIGPDGKIYLSDPCAGRVLRYDPAASAIDAEVQFDRATQGGPNGVAFDPSGGWLYTVTENTVLLCGQPGVAEVDAPLAFVFRTAVDAAGFGPLEQVTDSVGTFGDGLTFDQDGHLYLISDTVDGFRLAESAVRVLPFGAMAPHTLAVAPEGIIYANLMFGVGDFSDRSLYLSLLSVPPFAEAESRGVHRLDVGVTRGPLWQ